jgi:hypothetical protein
MVSSTNRDLLTLSVPKLHTGIGLLCERTAALAARVLLATLLLWLLVFRVPNIIRSPSFESFLARI